MSEKPYPFYLQNLANTLSLISPSELLQTQFQTGEKKRFEIIGDEERSFVVVSSGWSDPSSRGIPWGKAISGFGAKEIEFDLSIACLHWRVRAFYRNEVFVGLQYEAEPWEREFIIASEAVYDKGVYTLGESFYDKIGELEDDAINSLYLSRPPKWWTAIHPDAI